MTRQEAFDHLTLVEAQMREEFEVREEALKMRIKELELEVQVLRKETSRIWDLAADKIADERVKRRTIEADKL